jgi:hypothetical protein
MWQSWRMGSQAATLIAAAQEQSLAEEPDG